MPNGRDRTHERDATERGSADSGLYPAIAVIPKRKRPPTLTSSADHRMIAFCSAVRIAECWAARDNGLDVSRGVTYKLRMFVVRQTPVFEK